jgi:hypothetical protein
VNDWGWNYWRVLGVTTSALGMVAFFLPSVELKDAVLLLTMGVAFETRGRTEILLSRQEANGN